MKVTIKKTYKKYNPLTGNRMNEGYKDPQWINKRKEIFSRDSHKCFVCSSKYQLNVHHKYYDSKLPVWDYPDESLVTLCKECHSRVHKLKNALLDFEGEESLSLLIDMYWYEHLTETEIDDLKRDPNYDVVIPQKKAKPLDEVTIKWIYE